MKWIALCNGGPNEVIVGKAVKTRESAFKLMESMMRQLHATHGIVVREDINPYKKGSLEDLKNEDPQKRID